MPSADWEAWNTLIAKGKVLRLIKYRAWSGAISTTRVFTKEIWEERKDYVCWFSPGTGI